MRLLLPILLLSLLSRPLLAQPAELSRVVQTFDFEERKLGNVEDLPMHWDKVLGPGLPHYVNGGLSTDRARSGAYSFRLQLNGGSLIYRYGDGRIPVFAGAHYRVTGYVQTTPLPNARARISAYFADQDGKAIEQTVRHSAPFVSKAGDVSWKQIGVELTAPAAPTDPALAASQPVAKSLVIETELLQPQRYAASTLGQRAMYEQDIFGSAWFDDITVSQVPRITLTTDRPGNIFRQSDPLALSVLIDDQFTSDLSGRLVVTDGTGMTVFQQSGALDLTTSATSRTRQASLKLPALPAGWYQAALLMTSTGRDVGQQTIDFVRLADDGQPALADSRFGIVATDLPSDGWSDLPDLLSILSAGRVKLAVWDKVGSVQQSGERFDALLAELQAKHIDPTACLISLPPDLEAKLREKHQQTATLWPQQPEPNWTLILSADPALWQPQLAYLLSRHATHIQHWQIGADGSDEFATQPKMMQVYQKLHDEFAKLVEHPNLALPWPAWYELDSNKADAIALHIKPEVLPEQIPLYVKDALAKVGAADGKETAVYLQPLARDAYGRDVQLRDFVQRVVYALSADATSIDLPLPFTTAPRADELAGATDEPPPVKQPQELLLVMRTVMSALSGAKFKGKVPIADGVDAFLFERAGQGVIVAWDRGNVGTIKPLAINLGSNPMRMDLFGNVSPLLHTSAEAESASVELSVGPMPIFLIGVDAEIAQMRASIALDNPVLESDFKPHARKLKFVNPSRKPISGTIRLVPPPGWNVGPASFAFSLNPGEAFERSIDLEFPYNSYAGNKTIEARFSVQGETHNSFSVPLTLKLGLSDIGLQSLAVRDGVDVVLQQIITNYGEAPIDYTAFALLPGQPRQERLITNLGPGRSIVRKFRFPPSHRVPKERCAAA